MSEMWGVIKTNSITEEFLDVVAIFDEEEKAEELRIHLWVETMSDYKSSYIVERIPYNPVSENAETERRTLSLMDKLTRKQRYE